MRWMVDTYRDAWENNHLWAMPVVAETYDGVLNDINGLHVRPEHAAKALENATSNPPAEGNVGGGAGMICYEFKEERAPPHAVSRQVASPTRSGFLCRRTTVFGHGSRCWDSPSGKR